MLNGNLSIIFGTYWTGKTYYAVRNAYKAWKKYGTVVISNMWLSFPHIRWYLPSDLPAIMHEIYEYHEKVIVPNEAPDSYLKAFDIGRQKTEIRDFYVLCDEWGVFFNSRNFQTNFKDKSLLVMLAEPRHFNMQITTITQDLDLVDKLFRDLAQEIIEFRPFIFWLFRRAYSYDKKFLSWDKYDFEAQTVLDKKTYFHWFHRFIDQHKHFWWLYFTKEVLWELAIRRKNDIVSLSQYFSNWF